LDIDGWLCRISLTQYAEMFRANDIDGELLRRMTNDDLKDVGVVSFGHRKKLLEAIAELGSAPAAPSAALAMPTLIRRCRAASNLCIGRRRQLSSTPHESANDTAD
jgi:hypothetical protein